MRGLDRPVGDRTVDTVRPGVAVGEHRHRQAEFVVKAFREPTGSPGGLPLQMDDKSVVGLIEAVLDEPVPHTAGLNCKNELGVVVEKLDSIGVVRDLVATLADVLLTVDLPLATTGLFADLQRPHHGRAGLLGAHVEVLAAHVGDDLQILDELIRLVLVVELGLLVVPGLGEVVQLPQGGGAALLQLAGEELDGVDGLEQLAGATH